MKNAMPYYYKITQNHGIGAEYIMEAEVCFNQGDILNAEIALDKAMLLCDKYSLFFYYDICILQPLVLYFLLIKF